MTADTNNYRFSRDNLFYDGAATVVESEEKHIKDWRGRQPFVGLALSGGGIRSATYCLGVLQAMAHKHVLPNIDYLSTVSGGGYIGSSLTYLLHQSSVISATGASPAMPKFDVSKSNFPYVSYPMVGVSGPDKDDHKPQSQSQLEEQGRQQENFKGRLLRRLRLSSNYLVPGRGLSFLSLTGVLLRCLSVSAVVHVALLVFVFELLFIFGLLSPKTATLADNTILYLAAVSLCGYIALSLTYIIGSRFIDDWEQLNNGMQYRLRRLNEITTHWLFTIALTSLVIGCLPWSHSYLEGSILIHISHWLGINTDPTVTIGLITTVIGAIGSFFGFLQARSKNKTNIPTGLIVGAGSVALFFGLLLSVYGFMVLLNTDSATTNALNNKVIILSGAGLVLLLIGWLPNANYVSLHRFYRDRLLELFLPDLKKMWSSMKEGQELPGQHLSIPGDTTLLLDVCGAKVENGQSCAGEQEDKLIRGPYQIINANIVLTASQHTRYRPRGGDNFIFSPLFCGSRATGWVSTSQPFYNECSLATAMAISGAAVNPNAGPGGVGITRQPVLSVLMGLLNLRLGYWARNPKLVRGESDSKASRLWVKPNLLYPGIFESFGRYKLHENARFSLLTDGGHFENLGLYELVRRRLKLIIVCDATADPDFKFTDLANAIQKVRADFGAIIDISSEQLATLVPRPQRRATDDGRQESTAERGFLIAPIRYSKRPEPDSKERETGTLILLKATFFKGLPADLYSYRREHPQFPDQSTTDQFFDEKQFDSYRELGYNTAYHMLKSISQHLELRNGAAKSDEYQDAAPYFNFNKDYMVPSLKEVRALLFGITEDSVAG